MMSSMADIILNVKNVSFDSMVFQSDIKTEKDKVDLQEKGYTLVLTEDEFKEKCEGIDPRCIIYLPTLSCPCLYFNPKTLAVNPFHLEFVLMDITPNMKKGTDPIKQWREVFEKREKEVEALDFMGSILSLSDAMRLTYFDKLLEVYKDKAIPKLYTLFMHVYQATDFGFSAIRPETFNAIVAAKTCEDKKRTEEQLKDLPDRLRVYRGGSFEISAKASEGYSWTTDINVANFFASRLGSSDGYIAIGEVDKDKVIEAFLDESEKEIIVCSNDVEVTTLINLKGLPFLEEALPTVMPIYQEYRALLHQLDFAQKSDEHGIQHEGRVLLLSLVLGSLFKLGNVDLFRLATAAVFHDVKRQHDGEDEEHGKLSRVYYEENFDIKDPVVSFLIEYHCRPDEEGFKALKRLNYPSEFCKDPKLLYKIFKDADALDRVRFGIRSLDMNFLRLEESKTLTLMARLLVDNLEV